MAETNARIMDMVRKEIQKNPTVSSEALFEKAKKTDKGISDLSVRQFHARYPLQVKRAAANARKARAGGGAVAKKAAKGAGAAKKGARRGRPPGVKSAVKTGARRGRPPGVKSAAKTGARRGRPPGVKSAAKTGARRGRPPGVKSATKTGARRGRPPGSKNAPKQAIAPANGRRRGRPPRAVTSTGGSDPNRNQIRSVLLQFARDIAAAEGKADMVDVISNVDRWVDQVLSASR